MTFDGELTVCLEVCEIPASALHPQLHHLPSQLLPQRRDLQELIVVLHQLAEESEVLHEDGIAVLVGTGHDDLAVPGQGTP